MRPSDLEKRELPDWTELGFAWVETDTIYICRGGLDRDPAWDEGELRPFGDVAVSPAASFFSYGLGIFEGLKARRAVDGRILLFRAIENARRFRRSAERLMMLPFPEDRFVQVVEELVRANRRFVPPQEAGTLYVRPLQHATEARLGLRPPTQFWTLMLCSPVGGYFTGEDESAGLRLRVLRQGRCAPGGTGAAKAMGNYAGGIAIAAGWQEKGFDDVLYLDARNLRYLTETSGSNVFVKMKSGPLVTPPLDDQVLAGITRDSAIRLARDRGIDVQERDLSLEEVLDDGQEMFCTGTAWAISSIAELVHGDEAVHRFDGSELKRALLCELRDIQFGDAPDRFGWVTEISDEA